MMLKKTNGDNHKIGKNKYSSTKDREYFPPVTRVRAVEYH